MAVHKRRLTDRTLKSLKPAKRGTRYDVADADVRGLRVRVTDTGHMSFVLLARFPGTANPTRRTLGEYPTLSLEKARIKAREWRDLIRGGIDPRTEEERKRRSELRKQANAFDAVAEEFIKRAVIGANPAKPKQRRGPIVARELRHEFCQRWRGRPVTSISRRDVIEAINEVLDRGAPYQAHNLFGHVRSLFNWAIAAGDYGLEHSPCDRIRPKMLIGERRPRDRVLDDTELRAFWRATHGVAYPLGPWFRFLLLTGCRENEAAGARWREFDLKQKLWAIPPERSKSDSIHLIPLTPDVLTILENLPRFTKGDRVFSASFGERPPANGSISKAKSRLDKLMMAELDSELKPWRIHDLRRTVRTRLASLRVPDTVAEMVIGHGRKGLQRVYDQHTYEPEMREALGLWAMRRAASLTRHPPT